MYWIYNSKNCTCDSKIANVQNGMNKNAIISTEEEKKYS